MNRGSSETFLPEVVQLFGAIPAMIAADGVERLGARIDTGEHPGHESSVLVMGATADHIHAASRSVGIDTALPGAVKALYDRAVDDGHGTEHWTRIIDGIRVPRVSA